MRYQSMPQGYLIRLESGEEIHAAFTRFMSAERIGGGYVSGIGAVTRVTLGYFDTTIRDYTRRDFLDEYELVSLQGNLSYIEGRPMLHAHVLIAGPDMRAMGGHLFQATITTTGEFYLAIAELPFQRTFDAESGLQLLNLPKGL